MLRTVLGLRALPRAKGSLARPAWRDVWTRFLSSETSHTIAGARQWKSSPGPLQLLRNVSRHGAKRSNTGTWGETVGRTQRRGFKFSPWRRSTNGSGQNAPAKLSLGARLKKLSKEYGWSAVGVYLGLSVLDFPFCFLLVRIVGTETIGQSSSSFSQGTVGGSRVSTGFIHALLRPDKELILWSQARLSNSSFPTSRPSYPSRHGRSGTSTGTPSERRRSSSWARTISATR